MSKPIVISTNSEIIDINGYLTLAVYIHYLMPDSFKIRSVRRSVRLGFLREILDDYSVDPLLLESSRRSWLRREQPYPGYCLSPGTSICLPVLCNCKLLYEIWKKKLGAKKNVTALNKGATNQTHKNETHTSSEYSEESGGNRIHALVTPLVSSERQRLLGTSYGYNRLPRHK